MKGILLTIVDVLGVFIPGALLLLGLLGVPPISAELRNLCYSPNQQTITTTQKPELQGSCNLCAIFSSTEVRIGVFALAGALAYVFGFLNRLWSIKLLQRLRSTRW